MATAQFGDKGQYTYNVDSKGNPYGAPISVVETTPTKQKVTTKEKTNLTTGGESSDFMKAIQEKLLGQSSIISSTNSQLEERLSAAIAGIGTSTEKSNQALESAYQRERAFQEGQADLSIQNQLEGRSGFATQMVALRNLVETTDKSLKDLEMRKNELILQNDAAGASKIADLQFKALEFQQQAQQQAFSNLLGMANFGIQSQAEARLARTQSFAEQQATSSIALEYGLDPTGKTLDQITKEAMIYASEDRKAKLAQQAAELNYTRAQTAKALQGEAISSYDDNTLKGLAAAAYNLQQDPTYNVQGSQAFTQFQNLLGIANKGGDKVVDKFYKFIGEEALNKTKVLNEQIQTKNNKIKTRSSGPGLGGIIADFFNPPQTTKFTERERAAGLYTDPLTGEIRTRARQY